MNKARFEELAEAYGADLERWPAPERDAGVAFVQAHPGALDEARALDALLDASAVPVMSAELRARILEKAPIRAAWRGPTAWVSGLAAACAAGVIFGAAISEQVTVDPALEALNATPTSFDWSLVELEEAG